MTSHSLEIDLTQRFPGRRIRSAPDLAAPMNAEHGQRLRLYRLRRTAAILRALRAPWRLGCSRAQRQQPCLALGLSSARPGMAA